ncbi:MAG: hypothetical protein HY582_03570 [Candidatus Omnitrophica bacterium]|nr:hypothetical protein [Candidatus Omnitrophota bacterium]
MNITHGRKSSALLVTLSSTLIATFLFSGCTTIFGWGIHAPGVLSNRYYEQVKPAPQRMGLYLPDELIQFESKERGGRLADPQRYFIGESFVPMAIEGFQRAFEEFVLMEAKPASDILTRHQIPYLVTIKPESFKNRVTLKGQAVELKTRVTIFDSELHLVREFQATGSSDAQKVFAKKGGPEVNLNAAIENNITSTVQFVQDFLKEGNAP